MVSFLSSFAAPVCRQNVSVFMSMINVKEPIPLQDNVRLHISQMTPQKLNENVYEILPPSDFSPERSLARVGLQ